MQISDVYRSTFPFFNSKKKLLISYGGSSSGKTVSHLQQLFTICSMLPEQKVYCFAKTVPKLRTTLYDDMARYVCGRHYWAENFKKQEGVLEFSNGSEMIFLSADEPDKFLGVRSDYVFFDEINTYRYGEKIFQNIFGRCRKKIITAFNPAARFWLADYFHEPYVEVFHSTYKNNKFAPTETIENLISLSEKNENYRLVYLLGQWGSLEGVVFEYKKHWDYYTELPKDYDSVYYGMDFGFSAPTAARKVYVNYSKKTVWIENLIHAPKLKNSQIAKILLEKEPRLAYDAPDRTFIVCDSNEPKSIVSLRSEFNVAAIGAIKGADSVKTGINRMHEWTLLISKQDKDTEFELFSYSWNAEKDQPIKENDHSIDAIRYVFLKNKL